MTCSRLLPLLLALLVGLPGAAADLGNPFPPRLDLAGMDRAVLPGDDFFAFANGAWRSRTPIP